ncbi:MAG TPA: outer membrane beta-barrel protein [Gammaproteobacteria bacterium]|nr:outer membrane beta-barrel protein [Gammaproteobacteria bacterium]
MNNKRLSAMLAGVLFAAVAQQAAAAKGPEYSYAEIGYINIDGDLVEGDGAGVNISFGATDHIFLKFGYSRLWLEASTPPSVDFDADRFQIGGGMHYGITDTIDVLGAISYVDIEYSNGVPAEADEGYLAELGVRAMLSKKLELNATVSALHIDGDNDTGYGVGAVYDITKTFALSGSYNYFQDDSENQFFVGVRMGF